MKAGRLELDLQNHVKILACACVCVIAVLGQRRQAGPGGLVLEFYNSLTPTLREPGGKTEEQHLKLCSGIHMCMFIQACARVHMSTHVYTDTCLYTQRQVVNRYFPKLNCIKLVRQF